MLTYVKKQSRLQRRGWELYLGLRRTMITESPLRNILLTKRSLFTG